MAEPIQGGSSLVKGAACTTCTGPVQTDAKLCDDGQALGRTACVSDGQGTCYWDFPPCGDGGADGSSAGDTGSSTGAGGSTAGGSGGSSGQTGTGGASSGWDASSGTCPSAPITFHVKKAVVSTTDYCLDLATNGGWLAILDAQGNGVHLHDRQCSTCESCVGKTCTLMAELPTSLGNAEVTTTWDGRYDVDSTCGANSTACWDQICSSEGRYIAHVCWEEKAADSSEYGCTSAASAMTRCTDVPFDYPSAQDVVLTIPSSNSDGGADADAD